MNLDHSLAAPDPSDVRLGALIIVLLLGCAFVRPITRFLGGLLKWRRRREGVPYLDWVVVDPKVSRRFRQDNEGMLNPRQCLRLLASHPTGRHVLASFERLLGNIERSHPGKDYFFRFIQTPLEQLMAEMERSTK